MSGLLSASSDGFFKRNRQRKLERGDQGVKRCASRCVDRPAESATTVHHCIIRIMLYTEAKQGYLQLCSMPEIEPGQRYGKL